MQIIPTLELQRVVRGIIRDMNEKEDAAGVSGAGAGEKEPDVVDSVNFWNGVVD